MRQYVSYHHPGGCDWISEPLLGVYRLVADTLGAGAPWSVDKKGYPGNPITQSGTEPEVCYRCRVLVPCLCITSRQISMNS